MERQPETYIVGNGLTVKNEVLLHTKTGKSFENICYILAIVATWSGSTDGGFFSTLSGSDFLMEKS